MMSDSDSDLSRVLENFRYLRINENETNMNAEGLQAVITAAVRGALETQRGEFEEKLDEVVRKFSSTELNKTVEVYKETEIVDGVKCDETLDIVKSLPEFDGKQENYVSWRQAAHSAYKMYEKYNGSSKHYQAIAIIRNKIRGSADAVLSSFNTVLNFKAIIARLDFTYADKRPIYLVEQELSTLRQGNLTILQYYDEVERKLTLLTNKTMMTFDSVLATSINEKYRTDALRVFISGLKKSLSDVLFSARPSDLPTALALAQEVESNHERYMFATNYARNTESQRSQNRPQNFNNRNNNNSHNNQTNNPANQGKNPYYSKQHSYGNQTQRNGNQGPNRRGPVERMDVDPTSSRFRQSTNYPLQSFGNTTHNQGQGHGFKRSNSSERQSGQRRQKINHMSQENPLQNQEGYFYETLAESETAEIETEAYASDYVNFLGVTPCYRLYNEQ